MTKIAMITGATSGIGKATAFKFAENKYDIIITGRRLALLQTLAAELKVKYNIQVLTLNFDVRNKIEVKNALVKLPENWKCVDVLVNNAGLSLGLNPIDEGNEEDWETMIDTNVKGLLYVSKAIIEFMKKNNSGHIINIGSIAGKETYANNNIYCASKFAVDSITKTMRIDLLKYGIKVTAINPGATETEFSLVRFNGDENKAHAVYDGYTPLYADDVADAVYYAASRRAHVNINEILIMCTAQASPHYINKKI